MGALQPRHRLLAGECHVPHDVRQKAQDKRAAVPLGV